MAAGDFQSFPAGFTLDGAIEATVLDPGGNPTDIVRKGDAWKIDVKWRLTGALVEMICGTWQLRVVADPLGPGADVVVSRPDVALTPANGLYQDLIDMQNLLQSQATYQIIVELGYTTGANNPGTLAGLVKLGEVRVTP
ncbi:hypothetical protein AB0395_27100 [Streptosporangium sp. NPDC051023]|uniref:hypothetical protein n=1 Tax=Streptosporangium sp. NPDC051023 TaxID=3155410 RepID=UPI00344FFB68